VRAFFERTRPTRRSIPHAGLQTPDLVRGDALDYLVEVKAHGLANARTNELATRGTRTWNSIRDDGITVVKLER
jgi:hypothetical protein